MEQGDDSGGDDGDDDFGTMARGTAVLFLKDARRKSLNALGQAGTCGALVLGFRRTGAILDRLASPWPGVIAAILLGSTALAILAPLTTSRKSDRDLDFRDDPDRDPAIPEDPRRASIRIASYYAYGRNCEIARDGDIIAVWSAVSLALLALSPWAVTWFAIVAASILARIPTVGRMERWVGKRVLAGMNTAPPIDHPA